jgi:hypothetical protein
MRPGERPTRQTALSPAPQALRAAAALARATWDLHRVVLLRPLIRGILAAPDHALGDQFDLCPADGHWCTRVRMEGAFISGQAGAVSHSDAEIPKNQSRLRI